MEGIDTFDAEPERQWQSWAASVGIFLFTNRVITVHVLHAVGEITNGLDAWGGTGVSVCEGRKKNPGTCKSGTKLAEVGKSRRVPSSHQIGSRSQKYLSKSTSRLHFRDLQFFSGSSSCP